MNEKQFMPPERCVDHCSSETGDVGMFDSILESGIVVLQVSPPNQRQHHHLIAS